LEEASIVGNVAYGVYHLDDGRRIICTSKLSNAEMETYRRSPETFFHVLRPVSRGIKEPLDAFDFMYGSYSQTPSDKLLEFMADWPNIEQLRSLPQQELAEQYCARMAESMWANVVTSEKSGNPRASE
jgi:hypothetical protein